MTGRQWQGADQRGHLHSLLLRQQVYVSGSIFESLYIFISSICFLLMSVFVYIYACVSIYFLCMLPVSLYLSTYLSYLSMFYLPVYLSRSFSVNKTHCLDVLSISICDLSYTCLYHASIFTHILLNLINICICFFYTRLSIHLYVSIFLPTSFI